MIEQLIEKIKKDKSKKTLFGSISNIMLFMKEENHEYFIKLLDVLSKEEIEKYLKKRKVIASLYLDANRLGKIMAAIKLGISIKSISNAIQIMAEEIDNLEPYMNDLFGKNLAFLLSNNIIHKSMVFNLPEDQIHTLLFSSVFISYITREENYDYFIKSPEFKMKILSINDDDLITLLYDNFVFFKEYVHDPDVHNRFLKLDPTSYRFVVQFLDKNNYDMAQEIESKRNKIDKTEFYNNIDNDNLSFDYFVSYFFKDVAYNFLVNLKEMVDFYNELRESVIDKSHLKLYRRILKYFDMSVAERKTLFEAMDNNTDYVTLFYEDYRLAKDTSYGQIKNAISNLNITYNAAESKRRQLEIYNITDDNYYMFVHAARFIKNDRCKTTSLSLISSQSLTNFAFSESLYNNYRVRLQNTKKNDTYVTFGFMDFNIDQILHSFYSDSYSQQDNESDKICTISTPRTFIDRTLGYNEFVYINYPSKGNYKPLKKKYILAYGKITKSDVRAAKLYKLPIYLVKPRITQLNRIGVLDDKNDCYVDEENRLDNEPYKEVLRLR